jgi:signal transduction histidine kinase
MRSVAADRPGHPTPLPANRGGGSAPGRLDALHRRSGALTHDLNNLLGVVVSANERLADELEEGGEPQRLARLALEAAERAAELLGRALALAREDAAEPRPVDGAGCLRAVGRLARQAISPGVRLTVCQPGQPLPCLGDRVGLEMALLNLCLNAGQATAGGGSVRMQARGVVLRAVEARRLGIRPGGYVAFSVRDTGKGMSAETLTRATEPLFTTNGAGTGLGLSSVLDFAASAGGALSLQSREDQGTTATLYLPAVPVAADVAA